jgi:hypothetical protein
MGRFIESGRLSRGFPFDIEPPKVRFASLMRVSCFGMSENYLLKIVSSIDFSYVILKFIGLKAPGFNSWQCRRDFAHCPIEKSGAIR